MAFGKSKKKDAPKSEAPKAEPKMEPKAEPKNSAPAVIVPPPPTPTEPKNISEREKCAREIEALGNDRTGFVREEFLAAAKMLRFGSQKK